MTNDDTSITLAIINRNHAFFLDQIDASVNASRAPANKGGMENKHVRRKTMKLEREREGTCEGVLSDGAEYECVDSSPPKRSRARGASAA